VRCGGLGCRTGATGVLPPLPVGPSCSCRCRVSPCTRCRTRPLSVCWSTCHSQRSASLSNSYRSATYPFPCAADSDLPFSCLPFIFECDNLHSNRDLLSTGRDVFQHGLLSK
jgi:hypothetical protein